MNEIKKCSIAGISFSMEQDAYNRLDNYLVSLHKAYEKNPDGTEITADIEARIAELILSALSDHDNIVGMPLVENVIVQLGNVSDISGEDDNCNGSATEPVISRRLYRDTENARVGGVLAGLAKFFDTDPVWFRLAMFLPLLIMVMCGRWWWVSSAAGNLFGLLVLTYIIMWFVIPQARSARQKLEMNGEPVTVRNIEQQSAKASPEQRARSSVAVAVALLGRIFVILLKVFAVFMLFPLVVFCIALAAAGVFLLTDAAVVIAPFNAMGILETTYFAEHVAVPMLVAALLFVPAVILLYTFITLLLDKRPSWKVALAGFTVWLMLLTGTVFAAVRSGRDLGYDEVTRIMATVDDADDRIEESVEQILE